MIISDGCTLIWSHADFVAAVVQALVQLLRYHDFVYDICSFQEAHGILTD